MYYKPFVNYQGFVEGSVALKPIENKGARSPGCPYSDFLGRVRKNMLQTVRKFSGVRSSRVRSFQLCISTTCDGLHSAVLLCQFSVQAWGSRNGRITVIVRNG